MRYTQFLSITLFLLSALLNTQANAAQMHVDTTARGHIKIHHSFDAGLIAQLGKQYVRTYNDYNHITNADNNYAVGQYMRYLTLRFSHSVGFKNGISAGFSYGTDIYIQPYDIRAFIPLLLNAGYHKQLVKKLSVVAEERAGYSFYVLSKNNDAFLLYEGVQGGFTSETVAGLSIATKHRHPFRLLLGYRFQHLHTKGFYCSDYGIPTVKTSSNGFYHFIYVTLGVAF